MQEGRWFNKAPKGYRRAVDERGKAILVPSDDAEYVREAFRLASESDAPMEEIRKRLLVPLFPRHLIYRDGNYRTSPECEAIALLSGKTQKMKKAEPVSRLGFLSGSPKQVKDRTFTVSFNLPKATKRPQPRSPKLFRNPLYAAREWESMLTKGECATRAELARMVGVSRARVTQMFQLLDLSSEMLAMLGKLGDPLPAQYITERELRGFVMLPHLHQKERLSALLSERLS